NKGVFDEMPHGQHLTGNSSS
ncbi:hypothetical protein CISIN_1g0487531mg, partial [Citrus sinensis]